MNKKDIVKKVLITASAVAGAAVGVGTVAGLGLIVGAKEHKPINKFIDNTVENTKSLFKDLNKFIDFRFCSYHF